MSAYDAASMTVSLVEKSQPILSTSLYSGLSLGEFLKKKINVQCGGRILGVSAPNIAAH